MAINLAKKYANKIEEAFMLDSLVFGKGRATYDFTGVREVKSLSPTTVPLTDYDLGDGDAVASRFGALHEMEDVENTYTIEKDRAFNLSIDRGNNESQLNLKEAGKMLRKQVNEQVIPELDIYALNKYATTTGIQSSTATALTKSNIVQAYTDAITALVNAKVPATGLISWISATAFGKLVNSPEFLNLQNLGEKAVGKGVLGEVQGVQIIRVPDTYMPTKVDFLVVHPDVIMPVKKINTLRILKEHPDLDGSVLQGRFMYDAFVLAQKVKGVYKHINA